MNPLLSFLAVAATLAVSTHAALDKTCTITGSGEIKTYDDTHLMLFPETTSKSLFSRWDENNTDPCKFRLRIVPLNGQVKWAAFSVGVHKNANKFWRNFAFDRFKPRRAEIRGWQDKRDLNDTFIPYKFEGGDTEATLYGDYDNGYVINSTTCPGWEFRYVPLAATHDPEVTISIDSTIYQTAGDKLRGLCQNANGDRTDDYRLCRTLQDVSAAVDGMQQISNSCFEDDQNLIDI